MFHGYLSAILGGLGITLGVAALSLAVACLFGLAGAVRRFQDLVEEAVAAVPACRGAHVLRGLVRAESERLVPAAMCMELARAA